MKRQYPEVYAAIKKILECEVKEKILPESRLIPCTELKYSKALYAIKHGLMTVDEVLWANSLEANGYAEEVTK